MSALPVALVTDFDGTAVLADVGDAIVERLVEGGAALLADLNAAVGEGRMTLVELQERAWPLVRCEPADLFAVIDEAARPRGGFVEVAREVLAAGGRVVIASGGFDLYIERALGRALDPALAARIEVHANRMRLVDAGGGEAGRVRIEVGFPLRERFGCSRCGLCKGRVVDAVKAEGYRVIFAGDGMSDRCALGRAEASFCVAGSSLERFARANGFAHAAFSHYDALRPALGL